MDASNSEGQGILFVVATPIGNLEDITLRALKTLRSVSLIACEDTRKTLKLLNRYEIKKKLISYFHPREKQKIPIIIHHLIQGGDVALVSDAGTPGVSDPGYPLIKEALDRGIRIIPIPGPSAVTSSLSAAGLPSHRFLFVGFPPPKKEALRKLLRSLKAEQSTLIFYLPSRKIIEFLRTLGEILGPRQVVIARELTKIHEEFLRGQAEELLEDMPPERMKGEMTLLVEGAHKRSS